MIAGDIAPGLAAPRSGASRAGSDTTPRRGRALVGEADDPACRRDSGDSRSIAGFDADARAVEIARACVVRAGLEGAVEIEQRELADLGPVGSTADAVPGLVAVNPPYGERIGAQGGLGALYRELSERLRADFVGVDAGRDHPRPGTRARDSACVAEKTAPLYNGRILTPGQRVPCS